MRSLSKVKIPNPVMSKSSTLSVLVCSVMFTICANVGNAERILVTTAVIYDAFYEPSLPSFRAALDESDLVITCTEVAQENMTNIIETVNSLGVSSLFILAKHISCPHMIQLKRAITVFFVGMTTEHCEPYDQFLMYMYPSHHDVMQATYDGIAKYQWKTAAVFFDGGIDWQFGYGDLDLARQQGLSLKVWMIPEENQVWDMLKRVRLLGYRTYILICHHDTAISVFSKAVYLSMVSEVNHWIIPNLETHPYRLDDFLESSVRLTVISATTIRDTLHVEYDGGSDLRSQRDAAIQAVTKDALDLMESSCWNAITIGCFDIPLSDDRKCGIDPGAQRFENTSGSYYSVGTCTELYMRYITENGHTKLEYLEHHLGNPRRTMTLAGFWHNDSFVPGYVPFIQSPVVFPEDPLKVGLVYERPWVKWHVNELTGETTYEGFLIDLLENLSRRLNFRYTLVRSPLLGNDKGNRTSVEAEINRMLAADEVEFFLHALPILGNTLGTEEHTIAFQHVAYYLVSLASGNKAPVNMWQFLAPFTVDSWMVLWASLVFVSILLAVINHFNPFEWRRMALDETNDDVPVDEFNKLGFGNSVWMAYGGLVHQGVDIEPRSYAGRMITGTWWYFTMLVIAAYTANLTAFLTQEFGGAVESVDDVISKPHFDYGTTEDAKIVKYFLPHATEPPFSLVWKHLQDRPENLFNSTDAILDRVSQGNFFFLASFKDVAQVEQANCDYARTGNGFWHYEYALPFQIESDYTEVFSDAIAGLRDDGTLLELESKWFVFRTECTEATFDVESNRLGIGKLGGMFILLMIGCGISLLVHFGEIAWSKRHHVKYFRNKSHEKEFKDDVITEMKRRREQDRKELNQQIEDWESGFEYWLNRMDRINKKLEQIDMDAIKRERGDGNPIDSDDEDHVDVSWWTGAYENLKKKIEQKAREEAESSRRRSLAVNSRNHKQTFPKATEDDSSEMQSRVTNSPNLPETADVIDESDSMSFGGNSPPDSERSGSSTSKELPAPPALFASDDSGVESAAQRSTPPIPSISATVDGGATAKLAADDRSAAPPKRRKEDPLSRVGRMHSFRYRKPTSKFDRMFS